MTEESIKSTIKNVLEDILQVQIERLDDNLTANDIDGWDSITHIMIINELENQLSIKFSLTDLVQLDNIGNLVGVIFQKTN